MASLSCLNGLAGKLCLLGAVKAVINKREEKSWIVGGERHEKAFVWIPIGKRSLSSSSSLSVFVFSFILCSLMRSEVK